MKNEKIENKKRKIEPRNSKKELNGFLQPFTESKTKENVLRNCEIKEEEKTSRSAAIVVRTFSLFQYRLDRF